MVRALEWSREGVGTEGDGDYQVFDFAESEGKLYQ